MDANVGGKLLVQCGKIELFQEIDERNESNNV